MKKKLNVIATDFVTVYGTKRMTMLGQAPPKVWVELATEGGRQALALTPARARELSLFLARAAGRAEGKV